MALFRDRLEAGQELAAALKGYAGLPDLIVLGLPRGGVPVARVVADALAAPLDVLVVRKLGVPGHEELAMGAIASGGGMFVNHDIIDRLGVPEKRVQAVIAEELAELSRRESAYRGQAPPLDLTGKTALLVDDGIATGATVAAAVQATRSAGAQRVVVAAPVGAPDSVANLRSLADDVVCPHTPSGFGSVGEWYMTFGQTSDEEVRALLSGAAG
ncbi:MAG TPA: phosphoribosyltransferase family protein [Trueperaceae bacterium]